MSHRFLRSRPRCGQQPGFSPLFACGAPPMTAAAAEPQSVAEIATYTGADRQRLLEAGARKEGALMIYMTGTQIAAADRALHPEISVHQSRVHPRRLGRDRATGGRGIFGRRLSTSMLTSSPTKA